MSIDHKKAKMPARLSAVRHYSDSMSIVDDEGFEVVDVPHTAVLLNYREKLGTTHWATHKGAAIDRSRKQQGDMCKRIAATWNACIGISTEQLIALPDGLLSATVPYHALKAQNKELLADLQEAAATLRRYETLHRAKGTADSDVKAEVNATLASRFEATIAKATGSAG